MAKQILFGGPYQKENEAVNTPYNEYKLLVDRLSESGYDVTYINPIDSRIMKMAMLMSMCPELPGRYNLIIYDTGLFYFAGKEQEFAPYFVEFLKAHDPPIFMLVDNTVAELTRSLAKKEGFTQIDKPFDIAHVVDSVNSLLS